MILARSKNVRPRLKVSSVVRGNSSSPIGIIGSFRWYRMVANVFAHILPLSALRWWSQSRYDKQCKQYIHNTQLIFLARSLVNFKRKLCLLAKLKLKISAQVHAPPVAINFKIPRLNKLRYEIKPTKELFLKYINYIFDVLYIAIGYPTM